MDVNRDNFYDVLPEILREIDNADYVVIDGEFTGILPFDEMNYFDTPAERYKRHYGCDKKYLMIQTGLAMVKCTNPVENRYTLNAYNFYLFPENESDAFDFVSKSSSLQFLAVNRFDFIQLFLKGIPFVCKTTYLEKLKKPQPPNRRSYRQMPNGDNNRKPEATTNTEANSSIESNASKQPPSDGTLLSKMMVGFSEVMWKLQESGKPLIGHNLHMDLLHIIDQFFTPIPPSYEDYKSIVKSLFPKLIDTKTIASTSIFQNIISNTALNAVYRAVREPPFQQCRFETPDNFKYGTGEHEHTAGDDATCTAICMVKLMAFIAEKTGFKQNPIEHSLFQTFIGKLFYMRSFDLKYTDMINDDDLPDRSGLFYVVHPPGWSTATVRVFFQRWDYLACDRLDATTHIVAMSLKKETIETILTKMRSIEKSLTITPYAEFNHLDVTTLKIKQPNHLFDIDPTKRNSQKRSYTDIDAAAVSTQEQVPPSVNNPMDVTIVTADSTTRASNPFQTAVNYGDVSSTTRQGSPSTTTKTTADSPASTDLTIEQIIARKEQAKGVKKTKLFDYDDEWGT